MARSKVATVNILKVPTTIELLGEVTLVDGAGHYNLWGRLKRPDQSGIPNKQIVFWLDGVKQVEDVTTTGSDPGNEGAFFFDYWDFEIGGGIHMFQAEFEGDDVFETTKSQTITLTTGEPPEFPIPLVLGLVGALTVGGIIIYYVS